MVNNSRFMVLVDRGRHPNMASRVPALCLKRLSRHGQPKLQRSLITGAAMHGRQDSDAFVTQELGADDLWGLKGNQRGIPERAQQRLPRQFFSPGA